MEEFGDPHECSLTVSNAARYHVDKNKLNLGPPEEDPNLEV